MSTGVHEECCDEYDQVYDDDDGELIYRRSCDCICHCPEGDDDLRWPDE
jgi:hypothetical protein